MPAVSAFTLGGEVLLFGKFSNSWFSSVLKGVK